MENLTKKYPVTGPIGQSGERFMFNILRNQYDVATDYTDNFDMQCRGVDFGIKKTNWSRERLLDVKTNLWVGNINDKTTWSVILELVKGESNKRIGWFHTSQADRIYHVNTYFKVYVYYDLTAMREWVTRELIKGKRFDFKCTADGSELLYIPLSDCSIIQSFNK
jgi:hypothetical protein